VPWYRVKLAVKVPGDPATLQRRRASVLGVIATHSGKDVSPARPGGQVCRGGLRQSGCGEGLSGQGAPDTWIELGIACSHTVPDCSGCSFTLRDDAHSTLRSLFP
jgi:hypothetical protein